MPGMKQKILTLLLLCSFQFLYVEWAGDNRLFMFQLIGSIVGNIPSDPFMLLHPAILIPLAGMIMLLITLFRRGSAKWLTLIGLACLGLLVAFLLFIAVVDMNVRMLLSQLPFIVMGVWIVVNERARSRRRR